jgi:hypothetical protein
MTTRWFPFGPPRKARQPCAACSPLEKAGIPLECPVAEVWPEFVGGSKANVAFIPLLTHTASLCTLDQRTLVDNYETVIEALERQRPLWEPSTRQGYHARSFGFFDG